MAEEVELLVEEMSTCTVTHKAHQTFYDGMLKGQTVTLVQSGIGKVNAALATTLLIEIFSCDLILNTGSAGGIGTGLAIGDLVIADDLTYYDADNGLFDYEPGQIPQMPPSYPVATEWLQQLQAANTDLFHIKVGQIVTGDSFVGSADKMARIKKIFPKAQALEMEGAAVAQTCYQFEVPAVVVRCISDTADDDASVDFDQFIHEAGRKSAQLVLNCLENQPK